MAKNQTSTKLFMKFFCVSQFFFYGRISTSNFSPRAYFSVEFPSVYFVVAAKQIDYFEIWWKIRNQEWSYLQVCSYKGGPISCRALTKRMSILNINIEIFCEYDVNKWILLFFLVRTLIITTIYECLRGL